MCFFDVKMLKCPYISFASIGLPLERAFDRKRCENGDYTVRRYPDCHFHRLRSRVCLFLPEIQGEQARTHQHHRSGPAGPGAQRRDPLIPHGERGTIKQHQLRRFGRGLPHGLPPATLRGNPDKDHPRR